MSEHVITINKNPTLPYAAEEAVNRLRVNVNFFGSEYKRIMVISSVPNEGKSFVAMQLWKQLALQGEDALLIDADIRNSKLAADYDIRRKDPKDKMGASTYLSGDMKPEEAIFKTPFEHGYMLPNFDNLINPSLLFDNSQFKNLMEYSKENFRYTLIDCPPLGIVSDGEKIASMCDGAILVVRGLDTSKHAVRESINKLKRAGCPLLGIVLNRVPQTNSGKYYGKHYGNYYGKYYGKYYGENK